MKREQDNSNDNDNLISKKPRSEANQLAIDLNKILDDFNSFKETNKAKYPANTTNIHWVPYLVISKY